MPTAAPVDLDELEKLTSGATREYARSTQLIVHPEGRFPEFVSIQIAPADLLSLIAEAREHRRLKSALAFFGEQPPFALQLIPAGTEPTPENIIKWAKELGWRDPNG